MILVTGGAGFLGSHLCERLIKEGEKVICLDNLFTGSKANISHLLSDKNFSFVQHDIIEVFSADVKKIYNFACPASPVHYQFDAIKTLKTSVFGIENMLNLAENAAQEYSRHLQAKYTETLRFIRSGKIIGEMLTR